MLGFFRLEPTGGRAENVRFGMLLSTLRRLKGDKNVTVDRLFPDGPQGAPKRMKNAQGVRVKFVEHWTSIKAKWLAALQEIKD